MTSFFINIAYGNCFCVGYPYLEIRYIDRNVKSTLYNWSNSRTSEFPPDWLQDEELRLEKLSGLHQRGDDDPIILREHRLQMLVRASTLRFPEKYQVYKRSDSDEDDEASDAELSLNASAKKDTMKLGNQGSKIDRALTTQDPKGSSAFAQDDLVDIEVNSTITVDNECNAPELKGKVFAKKCVDKIAKKFNWESDCRSIFSCFQLVSYDRNWMNCLLGCKREGLNEQERQIVDMCREMRKKAIQEFYAQMAILDSISKPLVSLMVPYCSAKLIGTQIIVFRRFFCRTR